MGPKHCITSGESENRKGGYLKKMNQTKTKKNLFIALVWLKMRKIYFNPFLVWSEEVLLIF